MSLYEKLLRLQSFKREDNKLVYKNYVQICTKKKKKILYREIEYINIFICTSQYLLNMVISFLTDAKTTLLKPIKL